MKPQRIPVKPREGIIVIDQETNLPVPSEGAEVLDTSYNRRRIADGDLIVQKKPEKKAQ